MSERTSLTCFIPRLALVPVLGSDTGKEYLIYLPDEVKTSGSQQLLFPWTALNTREYRHCAEAGCRTPQNSWTEVRVMKLSYSGTLQSQ